MSYLICTHVIIYTYHYCDRARVFLDISLALLKCGKTHMDLLMDDPYSGCICDEPFNSYHMLQFLMCSHFFIGGHCRFSFFAFKQFTNLPSGLRACICAIDRSRCFTRSISHTYSTDPFQMYSYFDDSYYSLQPSMFCDCFLIALYIE